MKRIPGYRGKYLADEAGRIFRVTSSGVFEMRQRKNRGGYMQLGLTLDFEQKTKVVHRLIALTFIGPGDGLEVNHKNGARDDNRLENLEYLTRVENQRHSWRELDRQPVKAWLGKTGKSHPRSVPVVAISDPLGYWIPGLSEAARFLGGNASHISKCCRGDRKTHLGFSWKHVPWPERSEK